MQLQGQAEVMVPISLVVLNNGGLPDPTGTVPSHQTLLMDPGYQMAVAT